MEHLRRARQPLQSFPPSAGPHINGPFRMDQGVCRLAVPQNLITQAGASSSKNTIRPLKMRRSGWSI